MRRPAHDPRMTTFLREGGFLFLLLAAVPVLPAQMLRLDDVFTSATEVRRVQSLGELTPERVRQVLASLEEVHAEGEHQAVLDTTELLTAWLPRESTEYAKALWHRGRAYEALKDAERLRNVAVLYIQGYPAGEDRAWFLVRLARELRSADRRNDAAVLWRQILDGALVISPGESLEGAELLLSATEPAAARALMAAAFGTGPAAQELSLRREELLLETLLLADDSAVPVPAERNLSGNTAAAFNLRRALLLEIRGEEAAARDSYERLNGAPRLLSNEERAILAERRAALAQSLWSEITRRDDS